jgi:UDP:flavonoid glycosyltransferase YjiC (YdhE family)
MRILFAWELGANAGHLSRDLPIAERLREQGHEVLFALRELRVAEQMLAPRGFAFTACPTPVRATRLKHSQVNYSDILAEQGFAERAKLSAQLRAWITLMRTAAIDVVVSDFAPTALLAARVLGLRVEVIGPPFSVPPAVSPLPSIRPWEQISREQLLEADMRVLNVMNAVLAELGASPLRDVASMFAGITPHITAFAELDCYGARTSVNYIGPIAAGNSYPRLEWKRIGSKRVLAYLHPSLPGLEALLQAIQQVGVEAICVIPGAPDSMIDRLRRTGLNARNTPVDVSALLPDADVVIGYGSLGLIAESLLYGVPMLLLPLQVEHHLNAVKAEQLGAAAIVDGQRSAARLRMTLNDLLFATRCREAAGAFAEQYRSFELAAGTESIVAVIARSALRALIPHQRSLPPSEGVSRQSAAS